MQPSRPDHQVGSATSDPWPPPVTTAQSAGEKSELLEARSRLAAIMEVSEDAIFSITLDGTIVAWNRGAERIYGYTQDQILGRSMSRLVPPDREEELATILAQIRRGETIEGLETVRMRSTGTPIDVWKWVAPTRDDSGRITGAVAIVRDTTPLQHSLRQSEENYHKLRDREDRLRQALSALRKSHEDLKASQLQVIQSAKLESIGRLAAGVAHEVKNPLAIILMASEHLSHVLSAPDEDTASALADIQDSVHRADTVIRGLLEFSRATELTTADEDVNEVLERAFLLVRHALNKSHVTLVKTLGEGLPPTNMDRTKIEQVFVNLLINAIDAMPSGGTLTVTTHREQLTQPGQDVGYRGTDTLRIGESVIVVTIEDTGTGMDEVALARVFDPFFTTKPPGKGTGLGLAVCKSIIALHGGTIRMANRMAGGARATVIFRSTR